MLDVAGLSLTADDRELLKSNQVGGLILFSRNYESPAQLRALVREIRACSPEILIAVDQEGGRVQRFREGFTRLPPIAVLGQIYLSEPSRAAHYSWELGWLMAAELLACDIDISFAPVLDLNFGVSEVIGDRAFDADAGNVTRLAGAFIAGMREAGMASTGKHFPGHGWVAADSHHEIPVDSRPLDQIEAQDLQPFGALMKQGLDAVMPAHVIYSAVDDQPAGFSSYWIQQQLRQRLGFRGVVFSDDLTMEGASVAGGFVARAEQALNAGCDMLLVCNNRSAALEVHQYLLDTEHGGSERIGRMRARQTCSADQLEQSERWRKAVVIAQTCLEGV